MPDVASRNILAALRSNEYELAIVPLEGALGVERSAVNLILLSGDRSLSSSSKSTSSEDYRQRTVLLADSHQETLGVIRTLLNDRFGVVVMVADMESLAQVARKLSPDAAIANLTLPRNGRGVNVNIMKRLRAECPELKIIILSVHDDPVVIREVMAAGAAGYVLKSRAATDLIPVIEHVLVGKNYILPNVPGCDLPPK